MEKLRSTAGSTTQLFSVLAHSLPQLKKLNLSKYTFKTSIIHIQNLITLHRSSCCLLCLSHHHLLPRLLQINPLTRAVLNLFGTIYQFCGKQFFHGLGDGDGFRMILIRSLQPRSL